MASELHNVRLKLEEKRRRIESEKRKMELLLNKQRQKMGKEVFMQAVKGVSGVTDTRCGLLSALYLLLFAANMLARAVPLNISIHKDKKFVSHAFPKLLAKSNSATNC